MIDFLVIMSPVLLILLGAYGCTLFYKRMPLLYYINEGLMLFGSMMLVAIILIKEGVL